MMNLEYTGDVLIGEVRSSFSEGSFDNVVFSSDSKDVKTSKKDNSKIQNTSLKNGTTSVELSSDSNETDEDEDEILN